MFLFLLPVGLSRTTVLRPQLRLLQVSPCPSWTLGGVWGWMGSKLAESWWSGTGTGPPAWESGVLAITLRGPPRTSPLSLHRIRNCFFFWEERFGNQNSENQNKKGGPCAGHQQPLQQLQGQLWHDGDGPSAVCPGAACPGAACPGAACPTAAWTPPSRSAWTCTKASFCCFFCWFQKRSKKYFPPPHPPHHNFWITPHAEPPKIPPLHRKKIPPAINLWWRPCVVEPQKLGQLCWKDSFVWPVGTHGHHFFHRGGGEFFSCVHGSKMAIGEVMFLAYVAWVKGGGEFFFI